MVEVVGPARCALLRVRNKGRRGLPKQFLHFLIAVLGCSALAVLAVVARPSFAENALLLAAGDTAVTGFSGVKLAGESLAPGVAPIDKTVIDVGGRSLAIYDLSSLGSAPAGQTITPTVKLSVPAKDIGQVFPLTFDEGKGGGPANLYAGSTSAYGLNIVAGKPASDGTPIRLKSGAPDARFMDGQFGSLPGGSPGTIWKIDGATGAVSAVADAAFSGMANSGPGIGGLAFDPKSRNLYASDLDTGLIHRFGLDYNAANLGQFDHGLTGRPARGLLPIPDDGKRADITSNAFKTDDPSTWGFTQSGRRVRGLAVHDGRLYYSVDGGPEIWSVGLNEDGSFATDARSELLVKGASPSPVTGIAFDGEGRMLLAQRGPQKGGYDFRAFVDPSPTQVLRYSREDPDDPATPGVWAPEPGIYAAGYGNDGKSASGGLSLQYGYRPDGTLDEGACRGGVALTADGTAEDGTGHGVQINTVPLVLPANLPPRQSAFIALDSKQNAADLKGHAGAVSSYEPCSGEGAGFPPVAGGGAFPPVGGGAFPPVGGGGGGFPAIASGGGGTFSPPVENGGGGVTETPPVGGGGVTEAPGGGGETETPATETPAGGKITVGQLTVEKTGVSKTCNETDPCTFAIKVTNTGDTDLPGPITIGDVFSVGGMLLPQTKLAGAPNAPWTCVASAAPGMSCSHPGPLKPKTPETSDTKVHRGSARRRH